MKNTFSKLISFLRIGASSKNRAGGFTGSEGERVALRKKAKYWNQEDRWDRPDGELWVTDRHLVFRATVPTRSPFLSLRLGSIENLEAARVWGIVPAVRFQAANKAYVFTLIWGAGSTIQAIRLHAGQPDSATPLSIE